MKNLTPKAGSSSHHPWMRDRRIQHPELVRAAMAMNEREHAESYQRLLRGIDQQGLEGRE